MHAVVAGSLDPLTNGHLWLIEEAQKVFSTVTVLVAENASKRHAFSAEERVSLVRACVPDGIETGILGATSILVREAARLGATHIVRGIRNVKDFTYEAELLALNRAIAPEIETLFLFPPHQLSAVSSSIVRGLVGLEGWREIAAGYVPPPVLQALGERLGQGGAS